MQTGWIQADGTYYYANNSGYIKKDGYIKDHGII
ncbi:hypothetical protein [Faecalibacillus intestinalis]